MKKLNKKGFTIVELVIVIAVIAILAGVMIPTFGGIIKTANASAEMQKVAAAYKEAYALALADGAITDDESKSAGDYTFKFDVDATTGAITPSITAGSDTTKYTYTFANGAWSVTAK